MKRSQHKTVLVPELVLSDVFVSNWQQPLNEEEQNTQHELFKIIQTSLHNAINPQLTRRTNART